jgi:cell division protein FtsZ
MTDTTIIAVGCVGGRIVNELVDRIEGGFAAINTDQQELDKCLASTKLQIGFKWLQGLGAGGNPELGAKAAEKTAEAIAKLCAGRKSVVLVAGLGAGTGSGAAPVVARLAKARGRKRTAVVTMPFHFEGMHRQHHAWRAVGALAEHVDRLVMVCLDDLLLRLPRGTTIRALFEMAVVVTAKAVERLPELVTRLGPEDSEVVDVRALLVCAGRTIGQRGKYGINESALLPG